MHACPRSTGTPGLLMLAVLASGCHLVAPLDESKIDKTELKTYAWSQESPVQGFDVLIVVDTTDATNLAPLIGPLTEWIQALSWSLGSIQTQGTDVGTTPKDGDPREGYASGGMPTLHVGFVTSDMGAADWENVAVPGCTVGGDRGRLIPAAPPPEATGRFLHNFLIIAGDSVLNWRDASGIEEYMPLADGLEMFWAGVLQRPTTCPFQQPLLATLAAVDTNLNMENLGFVRYDAALGLLILAQQDDCSVSDRTLFSALTDPGLGMDLGARSPFRCFEFGVQCDDPDHIRDPGLKTGCRDGGGAGGIRGGDEEPLLPGVVLLEPAAAFAERLVDIKGDFPVVVGSIGGATDPIEVVNAGEPRLAVASDCGSGALRAFPSVRLKAFADALGTEMFYSLCNAGMTELMWKFNDGYQNQAVIRCFTEALLDTDPATPGLDPDCTVEYVNDPGTATEAVVLTALPCVPGDDLGEQTCWSLRTDVPECGGLPSLFIRLGYYDQGTEATTADVVRARCTVRRW